MIDIHSVSIFLFTSETILFLESVVLGHFLSKMEQLILKKNQLVTFLGLLFGVMLKRA